MRALILVLGLLLAGGAAAQSVPARPVRIVIGMPPSSSIDLIARAVADGITQEGGRSVLVENRTGAGGTIASEAVARSVPDGHTLFIGGLDAIVFDFLMSNRRPFDPFKDFTPAGRLTRDHWILAASPALGVSSLAELVELAKSKPGTLAYVSVGTGSSVHLMGERLRQGAGLDAIHVPYKESYMPDLLSGRVSYVVHITAAVGPQIRAGKLKGLAVFSRQRIAYLPDVPSIVELGLPDLVYNAGLVVYAPGATPRETIVELNRSLNRALSREAVRQRFAELGVDATPGTVEEAAKYVAENMARQERMRKLVFARTQ